MPLLVSENIFRALSLPLRGNNYELHSVSLIASVTNTVSGGIFGTSLDPYMSFPHSPNSILAESLAFSYYSSENELMVCTDCRNSRPLHDIIYPRIDC